MRISTVLVMFLLFSLLSCTRPVEVPVKERAGREGAVEAQYRKDMEEIRKSLKGDTRIKLKRDGKGAYVWEITGRDAQEVLKANDTLRKRLGGAAP